MSEQEPSGEVPAVSVSGSQAVQVGSGNNQYNAWMPKPPLDPAALGALNPHVAVSRLQQLSHDELVDFFAKASPEDVSEIIEVFFNTDVNKLTTALADISRRKAMELIDASNLHSISNLPEASEAIAREAARLRWSDAGEMESYTVNNIPGGCYSRKYKNGNFFWFKRSGVLATVGAINSCIEADAELLPWDFPVRGQEEATQSPFGTMGVKQEFQMGTVYSSGHGVFRIEDENCFTAEGASGGWLGFPVSKKIKNIKNGVIQRFEGGSIYSYVTEESSKVRSFAVRREVLAAIPVGPEGYRPASKEAGVVSSSGKSGTVQEFEFTPGNGFKTAVYSSDSGIVMVSRHVWKYYSELGAEKSWLGFPVGKEIVPPSGTSRQRFAEGIVYWRPDKNPIGVRREVDDLIFRDRDLLKRIGFPVSEDEPIGTDGSDRIQFFTGGVVTLRSGKYEMWLRPDADPSPETVDFSPDLEEYVTEEDVQRAVSQMRTAVAADMQRRETPRDGRK